LKAGSDRLDLFRSHVGLSPLGSSYMHRAASCPPTDARTEEAAWLPGNALSVRDERTKPRNSIREKTMPSTIHLHRVIAAKPDKIYRAFLEPDAVASWLPPYGFTCTVHELD